MIAMWLGYGVAVSVGLAVVAMLLERVLRSWRLPTRFVWMGALSLVLVFTSAPLRPGRADASAPVPRLEWLSLADALSGYGNAGAVSRYDRALLVFWLALSAGTFGMLAVSALRMRRHRHDWRRAVVDGIPVLVTSGVGPAVAGVLRPEIIVPRWLLSLDAPRRALILEHERQHVLARDPLLVTFTLVVAALLPWNPVVWMLVRRFRSSAEMDCDARVLRLHPAAREYARMLIEMGSRPWRRVLSQPALVDTSSDLERRVVAILGAVQPSRGAARLTQLVASGVLSAAILGVPRPPLGAAGSLRSMLFGSPARPVDGVVDARIGLPRQQPVNAGPDTSLDGDSTRLTASAPPGTSITAGASVKRIAIRGDRNPVPSSAAPRTGERAGVAAGPRNGAGADALPGRAGGVRTGRLPPDLARQLFEDHVPLDSIMRQLDRRRMRPDTML